MTEIKGSRGGGESRPALSSTLAPQASAVADVVVHPAGVASGPRDTPFPPKWRDKYGPLTVMAGPVKGWVMVRRPQAVPFVLHVSDLCNATQRPPHGPFELVRRTQREKAP
jgi:hypothetical protein